MPFEAGARIGLVHVDDMAAAFQASIDRIDGRPGNWPVFNVAAETVSIPDIIHATLEALNLESHVSFDGTGGQVLLETSSLRANGDTARAQTVLGWQPKRRDFLMNIKKYCLAWEAAQVDSPA